MLQNPINLPLIKHLGQQDYLPIWQKMQQFTATRTPDTADELWLLEHPPVFTQGQAGRPEHLRNPGTIPVIHTDRGGQITYHGPGQLILYCLLDLRRSNLGIRTLVTTLEQTVIHVLADYHIFATARPEAPGVYVDGAKIASVGLRVRKGCSYHGLAFNLAMDLAPFHSINPCGYANLRITQLSELCTFNRTQVEQQLVVYFNSALHQHHAHLP